MFSRAWLEVVTISKSARKSNGFPPTQDVKVEPVLGSRMFVTAAILTSLAVQFSFCFCTRLYSFSKQVCADAGWELNPAASVSRAAAPRHRNTFENLVRMKVFLLICGHT